MNEWWVTHAYQQSRHVDPSLHDHCFLPLATRHGHGTGFTPHQRPYQRARDNLAEQNGSGGLLPEPTRVSAIVAGNHNQA